MLFFDALGERRGSATQISVWQRGRFVEVTWDQWRSGAQRSAARLRLMGVNRDSRVACVLTNAPSVCTGVIGIWLAGGCVVSLPTIGRAMDLAEYASSLRRMCAEAEAELLLVEERYAEPLASSELLDVPVVGFEALERGTRAERFDPSPPDEGRTAFIQYSSGSTSRPKGCMLSGRAITAQLHMLAERLELDGQGERGVSWLPLSHDMGFFGCLMLSFTYGMRLALSTPTRFLRSPGTWFRDCARTGATITAGPTSGLDLAARATIGSASAPFPMRKLVIGGERVELSALRTAVGVLEQVGLTWEDLMPAYGLAEAVLAVTMPRVGEPPRVVHARTDALARGDLELVAPPESGAHPPSVTSCVSLGHPIGDVSVRVAGEGVGEVLVSSPSLASGYVANPKLTTERFRDGELRTGDLGFLINEELFVVGRSDDMVSLGGRNIFLSEVESSLDAISGVRRGSSVIVDVPEDGSHRLVILTEPDGGDHDLAVVADALQRATARASGLKAHECLFLPAGGIPKTPSGKVQRFRCRSLVANGDTPTLARIDFE
jgi:fatty-acyl-CoA synthase